MKKTIFTILFSFLSIGIIAQYQVHHYYHVPSDQLASFIEKEVKYWSVYHKNGIDKGYLSSWALYQTFGKTTNPDKLGNIVFVKNYSSLDQLNNMFAMYSDPDMMKGIDVSIDEMANPDYAVGMYIVREEESIGGLANTYVVNFGKPDNLNGFVEENKNLWKPLFQGLIKSGETGLLSWGVRTTIYPLGSNTNHTVFTYDGYSSLSHALKALETSYLDGNVDPSVLEQSKISEYDPNGFSDIIIYQLVQRVLNE